VDITHLTGAEATINQFIQTLTTINTDKEDPREPMWYAAVGVHQMLHKHHRAGLKAVEQKLYLTVQAEKQIQVLVGVKHLKVMLQPNRARQIQTY